MVMDVKPYGLFIPGVILGIDYLVQSVKKIVGGIDIQPSGLSCTWICVPSATEVADGNGWLYGLL